VRAYLVGMVLCASLTLPLGSTTPASAGSLCHSSILDRNDPSRGGRTLADYYDGIQFPTTPFDDSTPAACVDSESGDVWQQAQSYSYTGTGPEGVQDVCVLTVFVATSTLGPTMGESRGGVRADCGETETVTLSYVHLMLDGPEYSTLLEANDSSSTCATSVECQLLTPFHAPCDAVQQPCLSHSIAYGQIDFIGESASRDGVAPSSGPAPENHIGKKCYYYKPTSNDLGVTVCVFINKHDFYNKIQGIGEMYQDYYEAHLYLNHVYLQVWAGNLWYNTQKWDGPINCNCDNLERSTPWEGSPNGTFRTETSFKITWPDGVVRDLTRYSEQIHFGR
jgi:hypothetical protein